MKFIIKHEIKGRIRISLVRKFHTVREADVLEQYQLGLDGVTAAWNAVLEFFGGLSLFESGARLLSTFVDGIKSMASSVVESEEGVFTKVREYLPFSDAHVGPLSQLTLSGARMMSTLAEGVTSGHGGRVA